MCLFHVKSTGSNHKETLREKSQKSKVSSPNEVEKFQKEAPDNQYLATKVSGTSYFILLYCGFACVRKLSAYYVCIVPNMCLNPGLGISVCQVSKSSPFNGLRVIQYQTSKQPNILSNFIILARLLFNFSVLRPYAYKNN